MKRIGFIATLGVFLSVLVAPISTAADIDLPVLVGGSVSPSSIAPGGNINISFQITDDVGCCTWAAFWVYDSSGKNVGSANATRTSGTATNGTFTSTYTVNSSLGAGAYSVKAQATDLAERYTNLVLLGNFSIITPTPSVTPTPAATLPGVDASVNSTLSSIIEPLANTCEEGEISTVRADGLGFGQGDNVKVNIYNANNVELNLSLVTKSSMAGEKSIDTRVQICQTDPAYIGSSQDYKLVMTYSDAPGYFIQSQEYKFRLISRIEVVRFSEYASSQVRSKCVFDNYAAHNTYVQSGTTRKSGEKMTINGTFYRAGLVAPSDTLKLIRVVNSKISKVIATTTTDKDGKYSFTFEALTYPKALLYRIEAPERTSDLGPVPGPFPSKIWTVFIDCKKGCKIAETSMRNETPINNFSEVCLQNLSFYNQVTRQNDDENSRILRKVVIYPILSTIIRSRTDTAAKSAAATAGNQNLPNKPNSLPRTSSGNSGNSGTSAGKSKSSSSGGGSVYVKPYTRKDGTRVKGHTRSRR